MRKDRPTFVLFVREVQGIRFEWLGGEYITLYSRTKGYKGQQEALWITNNTIREPGWFVTDVSINVWDYDTGKPTIPFTQKAFDRKVDEWIKSNDWSAN